MSSGVSSIRSSPIPDLAYDSYRSLSLRDQTLVKRQMSNAANASHPNYGHGNNGNGSNLTPTPPVTESVRTRPPNPHLQHHLMKMSQNPNDYVTVHGDTYALTPYSGETLLFWILLAVLTVLVLANFTLTIFIFGSLRIGAGMESIEVCSVICDKQFTKTEFFQLIIKFPYLIFSFCRDPSSSSGKRIWTKSTSWTASLRATAKNQWSFQLGKMVGRSGYRFTMGSIRRLCYHWTRQESI